MIDFIWTLFGFLPNVWDRWFHYHMKWRKYIYDVWEMPEEFDWTFQDDSWHAISINNYWDLLKHSIDDSLLKQFVKEK